MRQEIAFGLIGLLVIAVVITVWHGARRRRRRRREDGSLRIDLSRKREP